jgi:hypothetical protein
MDDLDLDELKDEAICAQCVAEAYLHAKITSEGEKRRCRYCGKRGPSITLDELSGIIDGAFERHYARTSADMDGYEWAMHKDPESDYVWERKGEPAADAIMNAAALGEAAAQDIQRLLAERYDDFESAQMGEETHFSDTAHYEEILPDDIEWQDSWHRFEQSLKTEARFFSRSAAHTLAALFDDIDTIRSRNGRTLIVDAGPGTGLDHFYRARVFQSDRALLKALERPDLQLSAPPSALAAAGRMNARGISTFYGATEVDIALAEVRPPVGSKVAMARFNIMRPLRLLDLNALSGVAERGSIFDPTFAKRLARIRFLRTFCSRMSRPVMPDDQDSEYLPTQAVADYLATESKVPLDGILFPSVQSGHKGLNAVLFHKASLCTELALPEGTTISASGGSEDADERWSFDYTVFEETPVEPLKETADQDFWSPPLRLVGTDLTEKDARDATLSIDTGSIKVHVITGLSINAQAHDVRRYSRQKGKSPF